MINLITFSRYILVLTVDCCQGSRVLHSTSRGWAHLNTVTILVPSSWTSVPDTQPGQSVHEDAEVRVERSSPVYGDSPFTLQTGDCGDQGEFIQVRCSPLSLVEI